MKNWVWLLLGVAGFLIAWPWIKARVDVYFTGKVKS